MTLAGTHPVLSCDAARALEKRLLAGDEATEWSAMQQAGRSIATAVLRDFEEIGGFPETGRILVLVGKGHNGGDAIIAAQAIAEKFPNASVDVVFVFGERPLRPLLARAWRGLAGGAVVRQVSTEQPGREMRAPAYDLCLDGVFGFQFRPPAEPRVAELLARVNALPVRVRAAVDLPSAGLFRADFTYATGSVKTPLLGAGEAGRVRYLDLGFFRDPEPAAGECLDRVLTSAVIAPLAELRAAMTDKRTYGHVFVVGGSRSYPGAILMTVLAALRSGAGLVTAFVPESIAATFAARAPEAMWVGCPETPAGGLALEGQHLLRERIGRVTSLVIGPGLGREPETLALAAGIAKASRVPIVIDADALQPEIVGAGDAPKIVTPHAGEFARIAGQKTLREFAQETGLTIVLKGPVTQIASRLGFGPASGGIERESGSETRPASSTIYHSFFGGPVLARGGSGDLLAGLIGGLLAQLPADPLLAAARAVVWHGMAADMLARARGQTAVNITQLLDFLPAALRANPETRDNTRVVHAPGIDLP